jgi:hypothetical protein
MPHRFATTNARRETNTSRTTNAPRPLRSGAFTMQQSRQPPLNPTGWHAYCNNWNAPCHFAPEKDKISEWTPSGHRASWVLLRVQCCPRPYRPENALSKKV